MQLERVGEVAMLRMRAGKANAIGAPWLARMDQLIDEASGARALVITGYEGFFSAGLDLPALAPLGRGEMAAFIASFARTMLRIFELPLPVVAAVNGHAVAGGCVLSLQTDRRIAAEGDFRIGLNEVQLGIGLPAVVLETLRCQLPAPSLFPIAQEGRLLAPAEARALGLVDEVVPAQRLEARALERAAELGALPREAFAAVKSALRAPVARRVRDGLDADAERWMATWFTDAARELRQKALERLSRKK